MKKKMSWIIVTTIWRMVTIGPRSMIGRLQLVAVIRLTTSRLLAKGWPEDTTSHRWKVVGQRTQLVFDHAARDNAVCDCIIVDLVKA